MSQPTLEALLEARRATANALADTRTELNKAHRQARAKARAWVLPSQLQHAAVAMYQLAGVAEPAVQYLRACGRERH